MTPKTDKLDLWNVHLDDDTQTFYIFGKDGERLIVGIVPLQTAHTIMAAHNRSVRRIVREAEVPAPAPTSTWATYEPLTTMYAKSDEDSSTLAFALLRLADAQFKELREHVHAIENAPQGTAYQYMQLRNDYTEALEVLNWVLSELRVRAVRGNWRDALVGRIAEVLAKSRARSY